MPKRYRILRILEYYGTREKIDQAIAKRGVKGSFIVSDEFMISEAFIGEIPLLVEYEEVILPEKKPR